MTAIVIFMLICLVNLFIAALLILCLSPTAKQSIGIKTSGGKRVSDEKIPAEEAEEAARRKREYEESEKAFQELMNYNIETAYGVGTKEE